MLTVQFDILRRNIGEKKPYWQSIPYSSEDLNTSVAKALTEINAMENACDADGNKILPIQWECSCMQKKCGACAMVINGVPRLACDTKVADYQKGGIKLEPLKKFPVVADLIVDRSVMFDNLKTMETWLKEEAEPSDKSIDTAYEASRCLQCGCCLEVCPNFYAGGKFFGTAAMASTSRIIAELKSRDINKNYRAHFYNGCGKSLACEKICPAGIDVKSLMVNSNAAAVWKAMFTELFKK